jgi:hypothetical protein
MSVFSSIGAFLGLVKTDAADVEAKVKAITDKAASDVAAVRKSAVITATVAAVGAKAKAFETIVAEYKANLASQLAAAKSPAPTVTGATGATGATGPTGTAPSV